MTFDDVVSFLGPFLANPVVRVFLIVGGVLFFATGVAEYVADRAYRQAVSEHNARVLERRRGESS